MLMDQVGICASSGSAALRFAGSFSCLASYGLQCRSRPRSIRFSLGRYSTES